MHPAFINIFKLCRLLVIVACLLPIMSACGVLPPTPAGAGQASGHVEFEQLESKKGASALSLKLLTENYFWDINDEEGPFGNDDGADTYCKYVEESHSLLSPPSATFLNHMLDHWGLRPGILLELASTSAQTGDYLQRHMRNNAVIAVAFAQLINYGKVDATVRLYAINALKAEQQQEYYSHWADKAERQKRLVQMEKILANLR